MKTQKLPHMVIVGAGFGGMETARRLANAPVQITLIDRQNYHLFQPLLYQVAIAGLVPSQIAYPLRTIFRKTEKSDLPDGRSDVHRFRMRVISKERLSHGLRLSGPGGWRADEFLWNECC